MANEEESEDRLTRNEFAELIQHLSVQEILAIEYRIGTNWSKLFSRKNGSPHILFCNLCVLETSSFKNLLSHIDGRKHKLQMERVKQLYHSDYTYPKIVKKEKIEKTLAKKVEDDGAKICSTSKVVALSIVNRAPVEGDCDTGKLRNVEQNKTNNIKLAETDNAQDKLENIKLAETDNARGKLENIKTAETDIRQNIQKTSTSIDGSNEEKISNVDSNTNTKGEKRSLTDNNTGADVSLKKRKIVNPAAAVSSTINTFTLEEEKIDESDKKPQYQTDKFIIPTVLRNRSHTNKTYSRTASQMESYNNPKFSVKSYSSDPSENDVHGILGVEYVIKVMKSRNDDSPRYECGLCELVFDGFAMQRHLEGYNHRLKFCEKHFPTAIRQYRQYMQNIPEHKIVNVMTHVLAKLATAIEQHHGRNLPYECNERDFNLNRHEILAKAFSCRHASEQYGPTFTHVVGSKEVDEIFNNQHIYTPPSYSRTTIFDTISDSNSSKLNNRYQNSKNFSKEFNSRDRHRNVVRESVLPNQTGYKSYMSSDLHGDVFPSSNIYNQADHRHVQQVDDKTYNLMVDDFLKGTLKSLPRNDASRENFKHSLSPDRNTSIARRKLPSPLRQNDIWQAYRHMVDNELFNLDERFKQYRKDPETHPAYNEEWQKFWKRRKDELVSAGLDHHKYNYQPEWVRFVKIRIEELYGEEVENLKIKSRERLCLPLTNDNISNVRYHVQPQKIRSTNELQNTAMDTDQTTVLSTPSRLLHSVNNSGLQVVSVLRLMTALEDSLGSLGPKIIDLLSKALQTEKNNPLRVNDIILTDENCALIETAKEKLKGLVITGLLDGTKKRVLNQVVDDAEELLRYACHFKQQLRTKRFSVEPSINRMQSSSSLMLNSEYVNMPSTLKNQSDGANSSVKKTQLSLSKTEDLLTRLDKKELASKLAASLVAQGKTDFEPQQLQQLIAVYKLIEKKKRDSSGTVQSSSMKKTLSDTLSDILKSSSSSDYTTSVVLKTVDTSPAVPRLSSEIPDDTNSFASDLRNYSGNYFNNAAQSVSNSYSGSDDAMNQLHQGNNYGIRYPNTFPSNQYNSNMYNTEYENNRMPQNWEWNYGNMERNQNYNVGGTTNNFNQNSNWRSF